MRYLLIIAAGFCAASIAGADEPAALYIFPAGGQRGTTIDARIGGMNLHDECPLHWQGSGVKAPPTIRRMQTTWFEGPVIPLPDSQRAENYPSDYAARLAIAADAAPGVQRWRVSTSQGITPAMRFVVGDEPEIVEQETDGAPIPVEVKLPVTVNGRIFPREDVDEWSFTARRGQTVRCEVNAARLGSPLDAQLEIVDAAGRTLAVGSDHFGNDPLLLFTAPAKGTYRVRIFDVAYGGLQTYVYRLTLSDKPQVLSVYPLGGRRGTDSEFELLGVNVPDKRQALRIPSSAGDPFSTRFALADGPTNPVVLETSDYEERLEAESKAKSPSLAAPTVANGRIAAPGEVDAWSLTAHKGEALDLEVRAGRLGSPLDSVLTIADAAGKTIAENDDLSGADSDSRLRWTAPADGTYQVRVADRSPRRGGPQFAYRLWITPAAPPDFALTLPTDALTVLRGGTAKLKLKLERTGGFNEAVMLEFPGLPQGVTVAKPEIPKGRNDADLTFTATADAPIRWVDVEIRGRAKIGDREVAHGAVVVPAATPQTAAAGQVIVPPVFGETPLTRLALAVGMPTPFRTVASFGLPFAPRGGVFYKHFTIERGGYVGPLEVTLAEKQVRHLQGVQGGKLTVPAGVDEFDYPIYLPPWMELGRTSRSHVTLVGTVDDGAGRKHLVSYTSTHQNEQLSLIIAPGRLNLSLTPESLTPTVAEPAEVRVRLDRDAKLDGPVRVELIAPQHIRGLTAEPAVVPAGENEAVLKLRFASDAGPFNMPLTIRATHGTGDTRHVAETALEIVE